MSETQTRLQLEAGDSQNINFLCQPPKKAQSGKYNFQIEVNSNTSHYSTREQGILEVLPNGAVEFSCTEKKKIIPGKGKSNSQKADYELVFWNDSNLPQHVDIISPEKDKEECKLIISEEGIDIAPEETKIMYLSAAAKRHWFGTKKIRNFAVSALLSNPASGEFSMEISPKPNTENLELTILPIIPFLLQIGGAILIPLLLLLGWMYSQKPVYHQGSVNSVKFFGSGALVFSGSSDQTIRKWQVNNNRGKFFQSTKVAKENNLKKPVRVIRQSPKDNDVIAVGLENGEIKLWDISSNQDKKTDFTYNNLSRVFDLVFSRNGSYLYSGHGNRLVKQWNLESDNKENIELDNQENIELNTENSATQLNNQDEKGNKNEKVSFAVYALAIDESIANNPLVIIAGRYNKIAVWQPEKNIKSDEILTNYYSQKIKDTSQTSFKPIIGQQHYITSLTNANNILASADNQGYITLWDINKIRECVTASTEKENTDLKEKQDDSNQEKNDKSVFCNEAIIEQWRDGHDKQPVRSVALTNNGCYLASAGDDGKVKLWSLSEGKRNEENEQKGEVIFDDSNTKFNTVDIKALTDNNKKYILITSGDDNYQVRIKRIEGINNNESCQ